MTAIHEAALAELAENGLGRLSMEGIARRAGTAKTSLYRRWASPEEVLVDAIGAAYPSDGVSASGDDLRGDLVESLHRLLEWSRHPTAQAVQAILLERTRHPELIAALYDRVFDPAGGRFCATVLRHYAERGEVDAARLTPAVLDIGEALVMKYALDHGAEPPQAYLESIVDEVILPAAGFSPPGSSPAT